MRGLNELKSGVWEFMKVVGVLLASVLQCMDGLWIIEVDRGGRSLMSILFPGTVVAH